MPRQTAATAHKALAFHEAECKARADAIAKEFAIVHRDIAALRSEMRWLVGGLGALILALFGMAVGVG